MFSRVRLFVTPWTVTARPLCPWNFPGKNTGVGCHFLFQEIFPTQGSNPYLWHLLHWQADSLPLPHLGSPWSSIKPGESVVAQLCLTLWDPMDCSPLGSSVHGILWARILEWAAIPLSRGSSQSGDPTWVSHIAGKFFTIWATGKPYKTSWLHLNFRLVTYSSTCNSLKNYLIACLSKRHKIGNDFILDSWPLDYSYGRSKIKLDFEM